MIATRRPFAITAVITALAVVVLWLAPPIGFVACLALLVIVPPWGRSLAERAVISGIVVLAFIAIVFPRAGSMPIDAVSSRLALSVLVIGVLALYAVPALRATRIPRPRATDAIVLATLLIALGWAMSSYAGLAPDKLISGLFFAGWDNQGHFTAFANTYASGSTTWPTVDGSTAWNQWYPSLHTTTWAVAQFAMDSTAYDRLGLVAEYWHWSAASFAASIAAFVWVGSDIARRAARIRPAFAAAVAAAGMAVIVVLGSPQFLLNSGFTNFVMGVAVVTTAAYISTRSARSSVTLGWFLIPLAAIVAIGLWTPLVIVLVPAGVVVAIALWRWNRIPAIIWLVANAAVGVFLALGQSSAILDAEEGASAADFNEQIGAVGTGMAPFNLGMALATPILVILIAILLRGRIPVVTVVAPTLATGLVVLVFMAGADAAGVSRLESYYPLKTLDAMLLMTAPFIVAAIAIGLDRALAETSMRTTVVATAFTGIVGVSIFGYVGALPNGITAGFAPAPGIQAGIERTKGVEESLVGEGIVNSAIAAQPYATDVPFLWDGSGILPNLWVASLTGVMSVDQQGLYAGLPPFPYDENTITYVQGWLAENPDSNIAALWFRPSSGELLQQKLFAPDPVRVQLVQVPIRQSDLCPECE
jgi:hypothetical protein